MPVAVLMSDSGGEADVLECGTANEQSFDVLPRCCPAGIVNNRWGKNGRKHGSFDGTQTTDLLIGHQKLAALSLVLVDLRPVEAPDMEEIRASDPAEARHVNVA